MCVKEDGYTAASFQVGQDINIVLKGSRKNSPKRLKGRIVYKTDRLLGIKCRNYVESVTFTEFDIKRAKIVN